MPIGGAISNYPQGFTYGINVRGMPLLQMQNGNVYWLDNSSVLSTPQSVAGSDGNRGTYQRPFSTLAGALGFCAQGRGDIIIVGSGHRETISNATTVALNVAGVAVIGQGAGLFRPTFILDTAATANIPVRSAAMSIQNCLFLANFADITSLFTANSASVTASIATTVMTVTVVGSGTLYPGASVMGTGILPGTIILSQTSGTTGGVGVYEVSVSQTFSSGTITTGAQDLSIDNCEFRDISSSLNFITLLTGSASANALSGLQFTRNMISSLGTTAATTAIKTVAAQDRVRIADNAGNWAVLNDTAAMLATAATSITNFEFARNSINRPNTSTTSGLAISTSGTAWTGQCYDNRIWGLDATAQIWIDTGTKLAFNQNFCPITGAADKSGLINPAAV